MRTRVDIQLTVNGTHVELSAEPRKTLADLLRDDLGLTGTHLGCEQGVCGACTVFVNGRTARSCLLYAGQLNGSDIRTIEGVAGEDGSANPIQLALEESHGLQCGFCTPGMVISILELVEDGVHLTPSQIREALSGNLCRCTGYETIVEAAVQALDAAQVANVERGRNL